MKQISNHRVLITGGAKGIGLHTAAEFAAAGAGLILVDLNENALNDARDRLQKYNVEIITERIDVSDRDTVFQFAEKLRSRNKSPDVLINNAGIGHHAEIEDTSFETWDLLMRVNFWGSLNFIYAFLPDLKEKDNAVIVNVSSGQAFFRVPTWAPYAVIKLAIGALSEVLHFELRKYDIHVTTVYPYMVNTGFYDNVETDSIASTLSMALLPLYSLTPEEVGRTVFESVKEKRRIEMVNYMNHFGKLLQFSAPVNAFYNTVSAMFMGKDSLKGLDENPVIKFLADAANSIAETAENLTGPTGFRIDEIMTGDHEFVKDAGPGGRLPFEFRVNWGPDSIARWANPAGSEFFTNSLEGELDMGGFGDNIPVKGTLELRYLEEQKIRYSFNFSHGGKEYRYTGEKIHIYPWNLPWSHTTCFGEVTEKDSGRVISTSVTHFNFEQMPDFLGSLKLTRS